MRCLTIVTASTFSSLSLSLSLFLLSYNTHAIATLIRAMIMSFSSNSPRSKVSIPISASLETESHVLQSSSSLHSEKLYSAYMVSYNVLKGITPLAPTLKQLIGYLLYFYFYFGNLNFLPFKEKITLNEANDELDRIIAAPDRYNWALDLICYIVSSGAIAPLFFGGGVKEMLLSAVMGLMVGLFCILSGFWAPFGGLLELVSAFLVSFIAGLFSYLVEPICTFGTTLSGTLHTTHYTLHTTHYT